MKDVKLMCRSGGFHFKKFLTNNKKVLEVIPACDRRKSIVECNFNNQSLPAETAFGVLWNIKEDVFTFKVNMKEKAKTRRGMLSTLSSVYDALGLVAPFILQGRRILQHLCEENLQWDEMVPQSIQDNLEEWKRNIQQLSGIKIQRSLIEMGTNQIKHCSIHHFSDTCKESYGQVTYLSTIDENNRIFCNIVMENSRVTPLKFVSVPRLELTVETLDVKVTTHLKQELDINVDEEMFWNDSRVVLSFIQNTKRRFKMFVANRIHQVKSNSDVLQRHYIQTNENPADDCSRDLEMKRYSRVKRWFRGSEVLWKPVATWQNKVEHYEADGDDKEVKIIRIKNSQIQSHILSTL